MDYFISIKNPYTFAALSVEDVFQDTLMVSEETVMTHLYRALKWLSGMAENQLTVL